MPSPAILSLITLIDKQSNKNSEINTSGNQRKNVTNVFFLRKMFTIFFIAFPNVVCHEPVSNDFKLKNRTILFVQFQLGRREWLFKWSFYKRGCDHDRLTYINVVCAKSNQRFLNRQATWHWIINECLWPLL